MNLKIYEKTRYQNIYRCKKKGNYIIRITKPVDTSIGTDKNGNKIYDIGIARDIRDDYLIKKKKGVELRNKEDFDTLYQKYLKNCKTVKKLAYSTISRKIKTYNKYLKNKIEKNITKTDKEFWATFVENQDCSLKQKNQIIKELKTFFNWCMEEQLMLDNPIVKIKKYKVEKNEMKYWLPDEAKKMMETLEQDINTNDKNKSYNARMVKILIALGIALGDRIGESRALTFDCIDEKNMKININHSINYDTTSTEFLIATKTRKSVRQVDITEKLINELKKYKEFLIEIMNFPVQDNSLIFFNYKLNKPLSDTALRKKFYYYTEKAEVPKIRMYDLRHTFVTLQMANNTSLEYISEIVGHSNITTTYKEYGHLLDGIKKEIAKSTDNFW